MELQLKTERMLEAKRQSEGQKSPMRNKGPLCGGKSPTRRQKWTNDDFDNPKRNKEFKFENGTSRNVIRNKLYYPKYFQ